MKAVQLPTMVRSYKGTFGNVLTIDDELIVGATILTSKAVYRVKCGTVNLWHLIV